MEEIKKNKDTDEITVQFFFFKRKKTDSIRGKQEKEHKKVISVVEKRSIGYYIF